MTAWGSLIVTIGCLTILNGVAGGQPVPRPGDRVRLSVVHGPRVQGAYVGMVFDSLEVRLDGSSRTLRISRESVGRLQFSRGRGTGAGRGALIGGALGVISGVVYGLTAPEGDLTSGQLVAWGAAGFGVIGGTLGFFFGSFTTVERWGAGTVLPSPTLGRSLDRTVMVGFTWRY